MDDFLIPTNVMIVIVKGVHSSSRSLRRINLPSYSKPSEASVQVYYVHVSLLSTIAYTEFNDTSTLSNMYSDDTASNTQATLLQLRTRLCAGIATCSMAKSNNVADCIKPTRK